MVQKTDIDPVQRRPMQKLAMQLSPRCTAHSKRTGLPCNNPAVKGWRVCRMHGARGGGPSGKRNGNYRHGGRTNQMKAAMFLVKYCAQLSKIQ
jgi:hypothetical protein